MENNTKVTCWCGHTENHHGEKTVDGYYRQTACLECDGFYCDEWQIEFCTYGK